MTPEQMQARPVAAKMTSIEVDGDLRRIIRHLESHVAAIDEKRTALGL